MPAQVQCVHNAFYMPQYAFGVARYQIPSWLDFTPLTSDVCKNIKLHLKNKCKICTNNFNIQLVFANKQKKTTSKKTLIKVFRGDLSGNL